MDGSAQRAALAALVEETGISLSELSRVLGRNAAYLQQYMTRGSPRLLAEEDRARLARFFGVAEAALGGPELMGLVEVARLDVGASAGRGAYVEEEALRRPVTFAPEMLRMLGVRPEAASMIRVQGDSMEPTLADGDQILVDRDQRRVGRGIFVVRVEGELLVKRLRSAVGGVELVSDNVEYAPRLVAGDGVEVIGRVAWLGRAL
jgi:repressor LexA